MRSVSALKISLLVFLAIASGRDLGAGVRSDHPRLFVNTDPAYSNCLDSLRARVRQFPWRAPYEQLRMWRNSFDDVPRGRKPANVLPSYAIRWLIDPTDTAAADTALAMLMAIEKDDDQSWNLTVAALAYDWLYGYRGFSLEQKRTVRDRIAQFTHELTFQIRNDDDIFNNHTWYHLRAVFLAALALSGEHEEAGQWLQFAEDYWKDTLEPSLRLFEGGWHEGLSYSTRAGMLNLAMWLEALESASDPRQYRFARLKAEGDWLNRFTVFYAAQVYPDGTLARYNDVPEFIMDGGWDNGRLFLIVAREYRSGLAAWLLKNAADRGLELLPLHIWYYLLWYRPEIQVQPPQNFVPLSIRLCPGTYDLFFMRSGWERGATLVTFHAGDWFGAHDHLDVGHFTIFRKKFLALDAGVYAPMNTSHHFNFTNRSLAHNTLLIYDPGERFQVPHPDSLPVFNDGGQRVVVSLGGRSTQNNSSVEHWRRNQLDGAHFERATVLHWYAGDSLDFVAADLTLAYNSDFFSAYGQGFRNRPKVESVVRNLAFLKPDAVVIYDRVTAKEAAFRKTWTLNTTHQPYLGDSGLFQAVDGPAKLAGRTFLPERAEREIWGSYSQPFIFGGIDMRYNLDLAGYPDVVPGGWILRISPAEASLEDEFLHVLVAGDADQTTEDLVGDWEMIEAEGARAVTDGRVVLVFPDNSGRAVSLRLPPGEAERRIYLLGVPEARYRTAELNGKAVESYAYRDGVLSIKVRRGGRLVIQLA